MTPFMFMAEGADVSTSVGTLLDLGTQVVTWIQSNPLLSVCFAGCLVPVAFKVLKKAVKTVK